jgi:AraC-like DNA-binding protein
MQYQELLLLSENEHLLEKQHASKEHSHDSHIPDQPDHLPQYMPVCKQYGLCIGSSPGMLATLKLVLERYCEIDVAADISVALRHLSRDPPSLLLMHSSLPPPDGTRLLQLMRLSLPDCPVILIFEDDSGPPLSLEFPSLLVYTHLGNPHRFDELLRAIVLLLSRGRALSMPLPSFSLYVTKAVYYIGTHYAENLTVRKLGNEIGLSEWHLAHLFPVELGMTVKTLITKVRIEVAKQLLYNQSYTLEYIAEMVGFNDGPHLSRVFRQFTGCPPGLYRRKLAKD